MSITSYLSVLPLNDIVSCYGVPPKDAVVFSGSPRQNPADKNKIILLQDAAGPVITEFKMEDVLYVENMPNPVTSDGKIASEIKIWVRKGAVGVLLEPFEVNNPVNFVNISNNARQRFLTANEHINCKN
jgi:hypothetical protein